MAVATSIVMRAIGRGAGGTARAAGRGVGRAVTGRGLVGRTVSGTGRYVAGRRNTFSPGTRSFLREGAGRGVRGRLRFEGALFTDSYKVDLAGFRLSGGSALNLVGLHNSRLQRRILSGVPGLPDFVGGDAGALRDLTRGSNRGLLNSLVSFTTSSITEQLAVPIAFSRFRQISAEGTRASERLLDLLNAEFIDPLSAYETVFYDVLSVEAGELLRSRRSLWPVRTGDSRAGMYSELSSPRIVSIFNETDYAVFVEFARNSPHRGKAQNTIDLHLAELLRSADYIAQQAGERSGSTSDIRIVL